MCDGACKEALDAKYLGCVRGYVPVILEGGFRNEELRRILDVCTPNDRKIPLPLNLYILTSGAEANGPTAQAAVDFAIDVVRQDPLLFKGYVPELKYTVFNGGKLYPTGTLAAYAETCHGQERNH